MEDAAFSKAIQKGPSGSDLEAGMENLICDAAHVTAGYDGGCVCCVGMETCWDGFKRGGDFIPLCWTDFCAGMEEAYR